MLEAQISESLRRLRKSRQTQAGRGHNNRCLVSGPLNGLDGREPLYSAVFYPGAPLRGCVDVQASQNEVASLTCRQCGAFATPLCPSQGDEWVCVFCMSTYRSVHSSAIRDILNSAVTNEESRARLSVFDHGQVRKAKAQTKTERIAKGGVVIVVDCSSPHLRTCLEAIKESIEGYGLQEDSLPVMLVTVRNSSISVYEFLVDSGVDVVSCFVLPEEGTLLSCLSNLPSNGSYFCRIVDSKCRRTLLNALTAIKPCTKRGEIAHSFETACRAGAILAERESVEYTQIIALTCDEALPYLTFTDLVFPVGTKLDLVVVAGSTSRIGKVEVARTLQGYFHLIQSNLSIIIMRITALLSIAKRRQNGVCITLRTGDSLIPVQIFGRVESLSEDKNEQDINENDVLRFQYCPLGTEDAICVLFDPGEVVEARSEVQYLQWVVEFEEDGHVTYEVNTLRASEAASINEEVIGVSMVKALSSRLLRGADRIALSTELENFRTKCNESRIISEYTSARLCEFARWLTTMRYTVGEISILEQILRVGVEDCMMALDPIEVRLCSKANSTWACVTSGDGPSGLFVLVQDYGSLVKLFFPASSSMQVDKSKARASVLLDNVTRDFVLIDASRGEIIRQHPWFRAID